MTRELDWQPNQTPFYLRTTLELSKFNLCAGECNVSRPLWGQKQTSNSECLMSASPSTADTPRATVTSALCQEQKCGMVEADRSNVRNGWSESARLRRGRRSWTE